jgi:hypothetical protein
VDLEKLSAEGATNADAQVRDAKRVASFMLMVIVD